MPPLSERHFPLTAFIGAGNMAGAIIRGVMKDGCPANRVRAAAPSLENLHALKNQLHIQVSQDNTKAVLGADVVVLGVKPQVMATVCKQIRGSLGENTLIISLAAGINCTSIENWLQHKLAIVRCMSNTPAQIGLGASGLFANRNTSKKQKDIAEQIMKSVGIARWVETENLIDNVTALAGSGPAYFFLFIEAMIDAAVAQGLEPESARILALQTALGAAELAANSNEDVTSLRAKVTSPKGTTEQAIKSFESDDLRRIVKNAMSACLKRAQELARQQ